MCDVFDEIQPSESRTEPADDSLLGGYTSTPTVSQRSESGQRIMGVKGGNGMLLCMLYSGGLVVTHVTGDCSLAARRVNVPYLTITANFEKLYVLRLNPRWPFPQSS